MLISPVVRWGVQINFMPKPRMAFVSGGTILPAVRSWKAVFDLLKYFDVGVCSMLVTEFWNGVLVCLGRACIDVPVLGGPMFGPAEACWCGPLFLPCSCCVGIVATSCGAWWCSVVVGGGI